MAVGDPVGTVRAGYAALADGGDTGRAMSQENVEELPPWPRGLTLSAGTS